MSSMQDKVPPTSSALSDVQPEWSLEVYVKTAKVKLTSSGLYMFRHLVTELVAMNIKTAVRNLAFIDDL